MARYRIVHWRQIPSLVEAEDADGTVRHPLSARFQELIDAVAMREGSAEADAYLDGWGRGPDADRPGTAGAVAEGVAAEIEQTFEALASGRLGLPPRPA